MIEISICPNAGSERPKVREEQRRNSIRHGHHHYLSDGAIMPPPAHLHSNVTCVVPVGCCRWWRCWWDKSNHQQYFNQHPKHPVHLVSLTNMKNSADFTGSLHLQAILTIQYFAFFYLYLYLYFCFAACRRQAGLAAGRLLPTPTLLQHWSFICASLPFHSRPQFIKLPIIPHLSVLYVFNMA